MILSINHVSIIGTPFCGEVCKRYVNVWYDGGSEVVFEAVVSTDKPDSIASQESNATVNPLIICLNMIYILCPSIRNNLQI